MKEINDTFYINCFTNIHVKEHIKEKGINLGYLNLRALGLEKLPHYIVKLENLKVLKLTNNNCG